MTVTIIVKEKSPIDTSGYALPWTYRRKSILASIKINLSIIIKYETKAKIQTYVLDIKLDKNATSRKSRLIKFWSTTDCSSLLLYKQSINIMVLASIVREDPINAVTWWSLQQCFIGDLTVFVEDLTRFRQWPWNCCRPAAFYFGIFRIINNGVFLAPLIDKLRGLTKTQPGCQSKDRRSRPSLPHFLVKWRNSIRCFIT